MQSGGPVTATLVARHIADVLGWLLVAASGALMLTQAFGWNGTRLIATAQSLTPYVIVALAPLAGVALWRRRQPMAFVAGLIGVSGLLLASPLVFEPSQPAPVDNAVGLRVASVNLYFRNPSISGVGDALTVVDADVIVFNEYTAEFQAALVGHDLVERYPFRIDRDGLNAGGIAIWSRYPLVENARPDTINYSLDLLVDGPDGEVRVVGAHPPTPVFDFGGWLRDLELIGDVGTRLDEPTVIVGDFNASYWHPPFRDLLRRGFVDAHMAAGRGFATSWPTDRRLPPFVQLDHALIGNGLVSTAVEDFSAPGSDHRGFVVTVAPAR